MCMCVCVSCAVLCSAVLCCAGAVAVPTATLPVLSGGSTTQSVSMPSMPGMIGSSTVPSVTATVPLSGTLHCTALQLYSVDHCHCTVVCVYMCVCICVYVYMFLYMCVCVCYVCAVFRGNDRTKHPRSSCSQHVWCTCRYLICWSQCVWCTCYHVSCWSHNEWCACCRLSCWSNHEWYVQWHCTVPVHIHSVTVPSTVYRVHAYMCV